MGDRLPADRDRPRLAGRPAAAVRLRLGPLADRIYQRRDLWRRCSRGSSSSRPSFCACRASPRSSARSALLAGPLVGALLFPLGMTVVGSADGTPPFFGRLRAAYRDPRAPVARPRGRPRPLLAYEADLAAFDGVARFLAMFAVGALSYGGRRPRFDAASVALGGRTQAAELAALRARARARRNRRAARSDGISTPPSSRW